MYFQRKVQTFYLLRESVNAILIVRNLVNFKKQSRIGIVISASHSCGAELSLLRLKGLPEPVLYNRISTLRFLFITALLELEGKNIH